jgi:uncharacterized protein YyaL (SSP411 family)
MNHRARAFLATPAAATATASAMAAASAARSPRTQSYNDFDGTNYINSHYFAIKVDFDGDPKLLAAFERVRVFINLPAGFPLTGFLTPEEKLYVGGRYFQKTAAKNKPAFREMLGQADRTFREESAAIEREVFEMKVGESPNISN